MIVLDTAVLSYAVGGEHPLREPARRMVGAVGEGRLVASTTVDVIQEFAQAFARRRPRGQAASYARRYATLFSPLLSPSESALTAGLRLFARHERLDAFDAVLAATAIEAGATALVSGDGAFGGIRGLRFVELGSAALERLLGR